MYTQICQMAPSTSPLCFPDIRVQNFLPSRTPRICRIPTPVSDSKCYLPCLRKICRIIYPNPCRTLTPCPVSKSTASPTPKAVATFTEV
uniref:Uncharacterized protein n=1 Tax=Arundo donax TaxID=35708 RepID=A0A0A9D3C6_ARUDO